MHMSSNEKKGAYMPHHLMGVAAAVPANIYCPSVDNWLKSHTYFIKQGHPALAVVDIRSSWVTK